MAVEAELSGRKKKILKAVVELYVKTAEPGGFESHSFCAGQSRVFATIRNEMAELEEQGYLGKAAHFCRAHPFAEVATGFTSTN